MFGPVPVGKEREGYSGGSGTATHQFPITNNAKRSQQAAVNCTGNITVTGNHDDQ